ncbi:MAG TPA: ribonuclease HI [Myxococcales bacterium]|jgi:ribonuclease HI
MSTVLDALAPEPAGRTPQREKPLVEIHCDGACSPNPGVGGWGAILKFGDRERELSGGQVETTNNRMELTSAIRALAALNKPCAVRLHTDSLYVLNPFKKGWLAKWRRNGWQTAEKKAVLNVDLWQELFTLTEQHEVEWIWVKGHAENAGNNRADALAVLAREELAKSLAKKG